MGYVHSIVLALGIIRRPEEKGSARLDVLAVFLVVTISVRYKPRVAPCNLL